MAFFGDPSTGDQGSSHQSFSVGQSSCAHGATARHGPHAGGADWRIACANRGTLRHDPPTQLHRKFEGGRKGRKGRKPCPLLCGVKEFQVATGRTCGFGGILVRSATWQGRFCEARSAKQNGGWGVRLTGVLACSPLNAASL
jgi:hypothetical protein